MWRARDAHASRCEKILEDDNKEDCRKRKATGTHKTRGGAVKKGKTQKLIPKLKFEKSRNYPSKAGVKIQDPKIPGKIGRKRKQVPGTNPPQKRFKPQPVPTFIGPPTNLISIPPELSSVISSAKKTTKHKIKPGRTQPPLTGIDEEKASEASQIASIRGTPKL